MRLALHAASFICIGFLVPAVESAETIPLWGVWTGAFHARGEAVADTDVSVELSAPSGRRYAARAAGSAGCRAPARSARAPRQRGDGEALPRPLQRKAESLARRPVPNAGLDPLPVSRRKRGGRDGIAVRAPVATGSLTDLVVRLGRETDVEEVNGVIGRELAVTARDGSSRCETSSAW